MDLTQRSLKILGLKPGVGRVEIKKAFRDLAFQYHPDRNPHQRASEEKFKEIAQAYAYLTDNQEVYQALSHRSGTSSSETQDFEDIFKTLFDVEYRSQAKRYQDLWLNLKLTLQEAFLGGSARVSYQRQSLCKECQGEGVAPGAKRWTCTYCFGEAVVGNKAKPCPRCAGRGFLSGEACLSCRGHGYHLKEASLKVSYPKQWNPQKFLEIKQAGHEYESGLRGPVKVQLQLKEDPLFFFDGKNVLCEVEISMTQAALGGEIEVPTLKGSKKIFLPPGVQSGSSFRLKDQGLGGDLLIRWQVKTLTALGERERHLLKNLAPSAPSGLWQKIKRWIW